MKEDIYERDNLRVTYSNGDFITTINSQLAKKQNLTSTDIDLLKMSYVLKDMAFRAMKKTDSDTNLKRLASIVENIEYLQQELWRFERDKNYHRWFEVPKCSCPVLDNIELLGTGTRIVNTTCIIHGNK